MSVLEYPFLNFCYMNFLLFAFFESVSACKEIFVNISVTNSYARDNPFRYRGYYLDTDTGLYYLQSRYYDPAIGRFINLDGTGFLGANRDLVSFNLYAYCSNNPVMYSDPTGNFAISITMIGLIIGAIVGATIGGVVAYNVAEENGAEGSELLGWTIAGVLGGAVIGGAIGAGIGALITQLTGTLGFSFVGRQVFKVTETVVLGHYGYTALGDSLGYSYYQIPTALYNSMTDLQRWTMNSQFLNDCSKLGANFIVEATRVLAPLGTSIRGSYLYHEVEYLLSQGYQWLEDLSALVR